MKSLLELLEIYEPNSPTLIYGIEEEVEQSITLYKTIELTNY